MEIPFSHFERAGVPEWSNGLPLSGSSLVLAQVRILSPAFGKNLGSSTLTSPIIASPKIVPTALPSFEECLLNLSQSLFNSIRIIQK